MTGNITFNDLTTSMMQLYNDGKFADASALVEKYASDFPDQTARTTFWRLCLLSLCNRPEDVMSTFRQGLDTGLWWAESQFKDTDLNAVRHLPEFKALVNVSNKKCIEAQAQIDRDRAILVPDDIEGELPLLIALHGRNGDKNYNLEYWEIARQRGWLVLSPQSRQSLYPGSYCWDNSEQGLEDILFHLEVIEKIYEVNHRRIVIGGFSQGSGLAIYTALSGKITLQGFIGVGTVYREPNLLRPLVEWTNSLRGYFITGEKDYLLENAREIQNILKEGNIQFAEEVHSDLGHEFPPDFEKSFDKAIDFIFKEQE
jgi:predicted esterase